MSRAIRVAATEMAHGQSLIRSPRLRLRLAMHRSAMLMMEDEG